MLMLSPSNRYGAHDQSGPRLSTSVQLARSLVRGIAAGSKFPGGAVGGLMRQLRGPGSGISQNRKAACPKQIELICRQAKQFDSC